jgi:DNA-binding transcriptional MerR regulator
MIAVAMPTTTPTTTTEEDAGTTQYTIDELASVARVPSRTIRFYQSRGALMPPEIRGRVAYYGPAHAERLKLIAQLQDRGLRIDAIGDLLASIDRGEMDLAEWLGVEQQVQAPWAHDQPRTVTEEELYELAGTRRPGLLADLVRSRLTERHRDVYLVRSPALLSIAMKLEAAGIDLETASMASALVRKHLARLSEDVVALFMKRAGDGEISPRDLGTVFESLRPLGTEAVRVIFGRAMERELRKLYESGKMAKLPGKARKAKRR